LSFLFFADPAIQCDNCRADRNHDEVSGVSNVSSGLDEQVTISIPKGTLLVLFEFLAHSYEQWRESGNEQRSDGTFALLIPDSGERLALWQLEGAIERTLPEVFAPEYKDLVAEWKRKLTSTE